MPARRERISTLPGRYLRAGVLVEGERVASDEGTPPGGPLSPLPANIYLDALDKERERRGHRFCRYADDGNIYVSSEAAAKRVLESIRRWVEQHLRRQVNAHKSGASLGAQVSGVSHQPQAADRSRAGERGAMQDEGTGDLAQLPQRDQQGAARRVAAVGCRLVGLLPAGRRPAGDLSAGGLDSPPHPAVLLAALAQCAGSWPRLAALGGTRADAALCADASWRVVCRGAADDAHGLVERDLAPSWVRDAIGSRGPMTAAGSHRRIRLTPTSGGVGGCRGAIPGTRPDHELRVVGGSR